MEPLISRQLELPGGFGDPHAQVSLVQGHLGLGPQEIVFLVIIEFLDLVSTEDLGVETEVCDGTIVRVIRVDDGYSTRRVYVVS